MIWMLDTAIINRGKPRREEKINTLTRPTHDTLIHRKGHYPSSFKASLTVCSAA